MVAMVVALSGAHLNLRVFRMMAAGDVLITPRDLWTYKSTKSVSTSTLLFIGSCPHTRAPVSIPSLLSLRSVRSYISKNTRPRENYCRLEKLMYSSVCSHAHSYTSKQAGAERGAITLRRKEDKQHNSTTLRVRRHFSPRIYYCSLKAVLARRRRSAFYRFGRRARK